MGPSRTDLKAQSTAISNGIGSLHREHHGIGADRIRTMIHQDVIFTRFEDCFTVVEHTMIAERVRAGARNAHGVPGLDASKVHRDRGAGEGRKVKQFLSQVVHDPDYAIEFFLLEPTDAAAGVEDDPRDAGLEGK